jgi:archaellum component FlaC
MSSENDARIDSEIEQLKDDIKRLKTQVTGILNEQIEFLGIWADHREELELLVRHAVEEECYDFASAIREIQDEWEKKYPDNFLINKG